MKILYVHRTQGVGAEGAHILGMIEAFTHGGHHVAVACPPGCNPMANAEDAALIPPGNGRAVAPVRAASGAASRAPRSAGVYSHLSERAPQWLFELFELGYNSILLVTLAWKCLRRRPDLVYERYALHTFASTLVCRLFGIPRVIEVNDSVVIERSRPLKMRRLATFLERWILRSALVRITITDRFRMLLTEQHRLDPDSVLVFPNAISSRRFHGPFARTELRRVWGLEGTVIGASGQFLPWHGIDRVVQILGPRSRERNLQFLFIGDGPARREVESAAERLGISDRVRFTGMIPVTEVPHTLACLDLAVLPSVAPHASPMKLMEYMAVGLPLVAVDMPSVRALVSEREAVLVPPEDPEALRRGVEALLDDPDRAKNLGLAARQTVLSRHTWDGHAERLLRKLRDLSVPS